MSKKKTHFIPFISIGVNSNQKPQMQRRQLSENNATTPSKSWAFSCKASPALWVAFAVTSVILLGLAYWQLSKGFSKLTLEQQQISTSVQQPLSLASALGHWQSNPFSINDSHANLSGSFASTTLILHDNRILHGRPGYGVYTLLTLAQPLADFTHILVNTGWHPIPGLDRHAIPEVQVIQQTLSELPVTLEHIDSRVFTLDQAGVQAMRVKKIPVYRAQTIKFDDLNRALNVNLVPFVARSETAITIPELQSLSLPIAKRGISAAKHFGYGVQWLLFWCIAVGVFIYTQCYWYAMGPKR